MTTDDIRQVEVTFPLEQVLFDSVHEKNVPHRTDDREPAELRVTRILPAPPQRCTGRPVRLLPCGGEWNSHSRISRMGRSSG